MNPLPESMDSLPESIFSLPESIFSLPESIYSLPESIFSLPESIYSLPESINSLPESINSLLESINSLLESINSLSEAINSLRGRAVTASRGDGVTSRSFTRRRGFHFCQSDVAHSIRTTASTTFGKRVRTAGSWPGMMKRGSRTSVFILSWAARFETASKVWAMGRCLSRFS
jgi:hypothetical protein